MTEPIVLSEDNIIEAIHICLFEIDADDLARIAGELFGGKCYFTSNGEVELYEFYPDENYCDAFGKVEVQHDL